MSLRVVFDTSTLVSAAIRPDATPDRALHRAILFDRVYASPETISELERVLMQAKFDRYVTSTSRSLFCEKFRRDAVQRQISNAALSAAAGICRDPTDAKFLALCLSARAKVLISSDRDLLTLHPWREIQILTPAQFLALSLE